MIGCAEKNEWDFPWQAALIKAIYHIFSVKICTAALRIVNGKNYYC
jgi:hypothetical protein